MDRPALVEHVDAGCGFVRAWFADRFSPETAQAVRLAYGGIVSAAFARNLLTLPDLDGLGAGRKGRDARAFAEVVRRFANIQATQAPGN